MAPPTPRSDFQPPELRQDKFVLCSAVKFVVLPDRSHRTPPSVVQGQHTAGVPALLQGCQGRGQWWLSRLSTPPSPFNTPALAFLPRLIPGDFSVVCLPFQPCAANPCIKSLCLKYLDSFSSSDFVLKPFQEEWKKQKKDLLR